MKEELIQKLKDILEITPAEMLTLLKTVKKAKNKLEIETPLIVKNNILTILLSDSAPILEVKQVDSQTGESTGKMLRVVYSNEKGDFERKMVNIFKNTITGELTFTVTDIVDEVEELLEESVKQAR